MFAMVAAADSRTVLFSKCCVEHDCWISCWSLFFMRVVFGHQDRWTGFDFVALLTRDSDEIGAADANLAGLAQLVELFQMFADHRSFLSNKDR